MCGNGFVFSVKKKFLIIAASLFALAAILIVTLFALRGKSPGVLDADLKFTRATVSSNENAFFIFEKAREELYWPETTNDFLNWSTWDDKAAAEILEENQKSLKLIDQIFLCPRFQVPEIKSFDQDFEYLGDFKKLGRIASLRSLTKFHEGKEKEAFDSALRVVRFGHQIEDSNGTIMHYLVGSAVKLLALKTLRDMTGHTTLPCDSLQMYERELGHLFANELGLTNVIKLEYQIQCKMIDDMASGKRAGTNRNTQLLAEVFYMPLLNAGKTREIYAQIARTGLASVEPFYSAMPTNPIVFSTNDSMFKLYLSGNAVGRILARMSSPDRNSSSKKCRENVAVAATQVILALKCYKEKYGKLPLALTEMVPDFLLHVPLDDFDGKPLRYSVEKKIIYSVGLDLIDSGGQQTNAAGKSLDIPFPINF